MNIGIVHHLSSSGGTVISKCLAAMPNVVLLSEMHPLVGLDQPVFLPLDPLAQFLVNYPVLSPNDEELRAHFLGRLRIVAETCRSHGKFLIIRDHAHSDYLMGRKPESQLVRSLGKEFETRRLVTIRHPIDAWLSMCASGFASQIAGFGDYCDRVLAFLEDHKELPVWRYEDFIAYPAFVLQCMAQYLGCAFDPNFEARISSINLTGDSGRKPDKISFLARRTLPTNFRQEVIASKSFYTIADRLRYSTVIEEVLAA